MNTDNKKTLGQAIDEVIAALEPLDNATRETALRAASEHLGLTPSINEAQVPLSSTSIEPERTSQEKTLLRDPKSYQDIRSLREAKRPKSTAEMACIVAYYLDALAPPGDRKKEVDSQDLEKYFKQAGYRLPKHIKQVLIDAKGGGYFESAVRGKYKLSPVGYNLVVHTLPRSSE